jgi:hypothetical protein
MPHIIQTLKKYAAEKGIIRRVALTLRTNIFAASFENVGLVLYFIF